MASEILVRFFELYSTPVSYAILAVIVWRFSSRITRLLERFESYEEKHTKLVEENMRMHKEHYDAIGKLGEGVAEVKGMLRHSPQ